MDSWVRISTEHEPSYFASVNLFGKTETIIATDADAANSPVGMCSTVTMPLHINGRAVSTGYLGELRVMPAYRNKLRIIRQGFESIKTVYSSVNNLSYWFTSIAKENNVARRLLEANLNGMPTYQFQGEMATLAIAAKSAKRTKLLQCASKDDIPAIVHFYNKYARKYHYSPVLDEQWLRSLDGKNGLHLHDFYLLKVNGVIKACFALWDQRKFKQSVVHGYRFPLNIIRWPYNLFANLSGRVVLPATGKQINYIFIAFLALEDMSGTDACAIISSALALINERNADMGMLGLSKNNPLFEAIQPFPRQTYYTCIESVIWPGQIVPTLNPLPVQPEIALL